MKSKYGIYHLISLLICLVSATSCFNEVAEPTCSTGSLKITLGNINSDVETRSTPTEILENKGITPAKFTLEIVNKRNNYKQYTGEFKEDHTIPAGNYTLTATYGDNPEIGLEQPFYSGTSDVTVIKDQSASANITCKVANSLISIRFGENKEEKERFNKFYSNYGVIVTLENEKSATISKENANESVYFRSGNSATLKFVGVLAANEQQVSKELDLSATDFPQSFNAADHAIITLTLPDPESATVVDITKVELVEATMEETIPLSWLPIPQAKPEHQYDADGNLVGTDITFTNCYPGMEWKAVVTDAQNTVYRTVQGKGNLTTSYADDANMKDWPYIPAGSYKAVYYVIAENQEGKEEKFISSREFTVGSPDKLKVSLSGGYTSYTKYVTDGAAAANACNASTLNPPSATLNVSNSILSNRHYASLKCNYTAQVDNNTHGTTQSVNSNTCTWEDNVNNLAPRAEEYIYSVTATFDGGSATTEKGGFFITGLPASYAPPKREQGWNFTAGGNCSFESNYMKLATTVAPTPKAQSPEYYMPSDVNVKVTTRCMQNTGMFNYTYTLTFSGNNTKIENKTSRSEKTFNNDGVLKSPSDHMITEYSYIAAGNYLEIFELNVLYR